MVDDPSKIHKQFYLSNVKKYLNYIIFTIYCEKKATSIDKKNPSNDTSRQYYKVNDR